MKQIEIGDSLELRDQVTSDKSAIALGSGDLQVYSTPSMLALMEKTCRKCIEGALSEDETSVGGSADIRHFRPTAIGSEVVCKTKIISFQYPKVQFEVVVHQADQLIGSGSHTRFIVNRISFMSNL